MKFFNSAVLSAHLTGTNIVQTAKENITDGAISQDDIWVMSEKKREVFYRD